ncbi:MAG TPA: protein-tyrosine-phosphatase [Erythrobacter sp.]|nr:protein-tyrosine-phosphatase [Erythrobacter sp.]
MIRDRFLKTEGIHNFRDYGGYAVQGGGRVKPGLLFRSGQHYNASEDDLAVVHELDIRTIIDLRGQSERESFPCKRHGEFGAQVIAFEGETTSAPPHEEAAQEAGMTPQRAFERMMAVYTRMPLNTAMIYMFGRFLTALDTREGGSLVHCFAGKDRTGIAAMHILHILGVHQDDIVEEFLLTNRAPSLEVLKAQALPRMEAHHGKLEEEAVRALLEVRPEYIARYVESVEKSHGSLENYQSEVIGVDDAQRERLRDRFIT